MHESCDKTAMRPFLPALRTVALFNHERPKCVEERCNEFHRHCYQGVLRGRHDNAVHSLRCKSECSVAVSRVGSGDLEPLAEHYEAHGFSVPMNNRGRAKFASRSCSNRRCQKPITGFFQWKNFIIIRVVSL